MTVQGADISDRFRCCLFAVSHAAAANLGYWVTKLMNFLLIAVVRGVRIKIALADAHFSFLLCRNYFWVVLSGQKVAFQVGESVFLRENTHVW